MRRPLFAMMGIATLIVSAAGVVLLASGLDGVDGEGAPNSPEVVVTGEEGEPGQVISSPINDPNAPGAPFASQWLIACSVNYPGNPEAICQSARDCPETDFLRFTLWVRQTRSSTWTPTVTECFDPEDPDPDIPRPTVTPDLVLREVRRIGLPALRIQVQPADATLVNFDTIFYAEPQPFARTVQLLGYNVDVEATPAAYGWFFGDGQTATTDGPGAPYPAKDVVHAYASADVVERPSVDVTYEIRFRVDGGEWRSIDETVTADGPTVDVEVKEAAPVLSGD